MEWRGPEQWGKKRKKKKTRNEAGCFAHVFGLCRSHRCLSLLLCWSSFPSAPVSASEHQACHTPFQTIRFSDYHSRTIKRNLSIATLPDGPTLAFLQPKESPAATGTLVQRIHPTPTEMWRGWCFTGWLEICYNRKRNPHRKLVISTHRNLLDWPYRASGVVSTGYKQWGSRGVEQQSHRQWESQAFFARLLGAPASLVLQRHIQAGRMFCNKNRKKRCTYQQGK